MQTTLETRTSKFLEHVLRIVRTVGVVLMIVAVSTLVMNPGYASENDDSESAGAASLDAPLQVMDRADTIANLALETQADVSMVVTDGRLRLMDTADTIKALRIDSESEKPQQQDNPPVPLPRH